MDTPRRRALAGAAAIVAAAVGTAAAQMPGGGAGRQGRTGAGGPPGAGTPGDERRDPGALATNLADQARRQLFELEDDLNLTGAQRPAWNAYQDRVSRLADDVVRHRNDVRFPTGTAPEQLDFVAQVMRNRTTAVEDIGDAGKALYAVLTVEQKAKADNRLARIPLPLIVPILAVAAAPGRGLAPPGSGTR